MDAAARIKPDRSAVRDEWRKADVLAKVDGAAPTLGVDRSLTARLDRADETAIALSSTSSTASRSRTAARCVAC